ncbi:MAG: DNA translocase FtsK [Pseudobdellovibrionaceae bacterium]
MSRFFQKFKQDVFGILFLSLGVFVGLSLISFNPIDPSLNSIGSGMTVTNYCGYVGSFLSDLLFQLFGLSSWLIVVGLFRLGVSAFQGEAISVKNIRLVWASLLVLTFSALVSVYFPLTKIHSEQIYLGGLLGLGLSQVLLKAFNPVGVQVLLWTSMCILLVFFSERTVKELLRAPLQLWKKFEGLSLGLKFQNFFRTENQLKPAAAVATPVPVKFPQPTQQALDLQDDQFAEDSKEEPDELLELPEIEIKPVQRRKVVLAKKVPQRVENWELPKLSLLQDPPATRHRIDPKEVQKRGEILRQKLQIHGVEGEVVAARPGPAVTLFEFKPAPNVKLSKITELEDDLALALSSESLRILAPIPGRDVVGIETSNPTRETVYLKDILASDDFWKEDLTLPIALGKQVNGDPKILDLRKMPHLMVAGTTGSGKSVFTVSMLTGFLFKHSPKTLRLIMVDPKQVDLKAFEKIPHLALPIVTDPRMAVNSLKWAAREMDKRNKSMSKFGARKLEEFNEIVSKLTADEIAEHEKINNELEQTPGKKADKYYYSPQPYLVIVVEEFGDLMTIDKANVEQSIVRIAQMGRACGTHLIIAMQSPRKEVVTGLVKTNIPGRISFKVNSVMDSRIILDETGADRLLAQGDMLVRAPGSSSSVRHHGPFLENEEIEGVADFWAKQSSPLFDHAALKAMEGGTGDSGSGEGMDSDGDEYDEQYDHIVSWISTRETVSTTQIQQHFKLGYPRAARLMQQLESQGVVSQASGSKPRQVLVNNLNRLAE